MRKRARAEEIHSRHIHELEESVRLSKRFTDEAQNSLESLSRFATSVQLSRSLLSSAKALQASLSNFLQLISMSYDEKEADERACNGSPKDFTSNLTRTNNCKASPSGILPSISDMMKMTFSDASHNLPSISNNLTSSDSTTQTTMNSVASFISSSTISPTTTTNLISISRITSGKFAHVQTTGEEEEICKVSPRDLSQDLQRSMSCAKEASEVQAFKESGNQLGEMEIDQADVDLSRKRIYRRIVKRSPTHEGKSRGDSMICSNCGITNTPQWRKGPDDKPCLCNACGLYYATLRRKLRKGKLGKEKSHSE